MAEVPVSLKALVEFSELAVSDFKDKKSYQVIAGDLLSKVGQLLLAEANLKAEAEAFGYGASIGFVAGSIADSILKKTDASAAQG